MTGIPDHFRLVEQIDDKYALYTNTITGRDIHIKHPICIEEVNVYEALIGTISAPFLHSVPQTSEGSALVLAEFGPCLEDLLELCGGHFSLRTTLFVGRQMLKRLQEVHERGVFPKEVSLKNIAIGTLKATSQLYIIDFVSPEQPTDTNTFTTATSLIRHDLISLASLLLHIGTGKLHSVQRASNEQTIAQSNLILENLMLENDLPEEFRQYLDYIFSLDTSSKPDYTFLGSLFHTCIGRMGYINIEPDWKLAALASRTFEGHLDPGRVHLEYLRLQERAQNPFSREDILDKFTSSHQEYIKSRTDSVKAFENATNLKTISNEQWRELVASYEKYFNGFVDLCTIAHQPSSDQGLLGNVDTQQMWGLVSRFLDFLQEQLPSSAEHLDGFSAMLYRSMGVLLESAPTFMAAWFEFLGDLARYRIILHPQWRSIWESNRDSWCERRKQLTMNKR